MNLKSWQLSLKYLLKFFRRKSQTPSILQMEAVECGAATLAMILAHYGRIVSLEEARQACGVTRDGSKAINVVEAARHYGMEAEGLSVDDIESLKTLEPPYIVFWQFNHFIVVEEISEDTVYVNDPAYGPDMLSYDEFNQGFTGIVLSMTPGKDFKKGGENPSIIEAIIRRFRRFEKPLYFIMIANLFLVIPGVIIPGFTKVFIDEILVRGLHHWLAPLLFGLGLTALMRAGLDLLQNLMMLRLRIKLALTSSAEFLWHVLHLPVSFFNQRFAGDIGERISANTRVATILSENVAMACISVISMMFYGIAMFFINVPLTVIIIFSAFLNFTVLYYVARKLADLSRRNLQITGRLGGFEMSGLQAIQNTKSMAMEDDFFKHWSGQHAHYINSAHNMSLIMQGLNIMPQLVNGLTQITLLCLGAYLVIEGHLTVGSLVALQTLMSSFTAPIQDLLGFGSELQTIQGDLSRLDDVLNHPVDARVAIKGKENSKIADSKPSINLKNLTFGYSPVDPPFVKDLSLKVKWGEHIALVGATGSGKSTLAKLLTGLYQPWEGEIAYQDHPLDHFAQAELAQMISFVDQDVFLFEGSVKENLTLWNENIPDEGLYQALQDVMMHEDLSYRGMLAAHVTEGGANFSGGQRQRLELARALVNNPRILVLDEATANLDSVTEKLIYDNLRKRACTLVVISHRISAIRDCDNIYVFDEGNIVEHGQHAALMEKKGLYHALLQGE